MPLDFRNKSRLTCEKQPFVNIVSNPNASESEWLAAIQKLEGYTPSETTTPITNRRSFGLMFLVTAIIVTGVIANSLHPISLKAGNSESSVSTVDLNTYVEHLQPAIKKNWHPPRCEVSRTCVVQFKLSRNGEMTNLKLTQPSGLHELDQSGLDAIANTKFEPLPFGSDPSIDIQFTFDYNVVPK